MNNLDLKIKQFDIKNIKKNAAIALIAKRGSGKSWVCRDIIKQMSDRTVGYVLS